MRYKILDQNGLNYLTFTMVEWIDLFTRPVYKDIIVESLAFCQREKALRVHAFVIMSNHVHAILSTESEAGLSSIINSFKSFTAKAFLQYLKGDKNPESRREWLLNHFAFNARKNKTKSQYQIWQSSNHPVLLYSPKVIRQKVSYIHNNPVVLGIVEHAEDYVYSSASNYARDGEGVLIVDVLDVLWNDVGWIQT